MKKQNTRELHAFECELLIDKNVPIASFIYLSYYGLGNKLNSSDATHQAEKLLPELYALSTAINTRIRLNNEPLYLLKLQDL